MMRSQSLLSWKCTKKHNGRELLVNSLLVNAFTVACFFEYTLLQEKVLLRFPICLTIFYVSKASADTSLLVFERIHTNSNDKIFNGVAKCLEL